MNNENSKGNLTQSQKNTGCNTDGLNQLKIVSEAKQLLTDFGYTILSPNRKKEIISLLNDQSEKIENLENRLNQNTNFKNTSSSKANPVRVKA